MNIYILILPEDQLESPDTLHLKMILNITNQCVHIVHYICIYLSNSYPY